MRCNPWRWMWGLIPIAMLTWVANVWERPGIEADLQARATQALERDGLGWAKIGFQGRDAILTGKASDETEPKLALETLRRTWGVRVTKSRTDLVERVERYGWGAALDDRKIKLTGFVPTEAARRNILGLVKANFPKATISDEMTLARGAPSSELWQSGAGFALKQLTGLKRGNVNLSDATFSISGEANDSPSFKSIRTAVATKLPKGFTLDRNTVTPPAVSPFTWSAKYSASQLLLSGYVPSEAVKDSLFAHAKKTFPKVALVDRLEVAGGAPPNWADAATESLDQLYQLQDGTAEMRGTELMLSGQAEDEATAAAVRQAIKNVSSKGFKVSDAIKAPKPAAVPTAAPTAAPVGAFATSAALIDGRIILTGYVPSEAGRASVLAAVRARFAGKTIDDKLQVAAGAPAGWEKCVLAGLAGIGRLENGEATLTNDRLLVTGSTPDQNAAIAVPVDLRSATTGSCDADARIFVSRTGPPTFWWQATKAKDGAVILEGEAPDASSRAQLVQTAEAVFVGARIEDKMTVVSKRSETWPAVTAHALKLLARLRSGDASLSGDDVLVRGIAETDEIASAVRQQVKALPQGFNGRDELKVEADLSARAAADAAAAAAAARAEAQRQSEAEAEAKRVAEERALEMKRQAEAEAVRKAQLDAASACQRLLADAASQGTVQFDRASADLSRGSTATIIKLAKIANECPKTRIEISGHTDSEGIPERNQPLSERRAAAVASALIKAGVSETRLTAEGFGAEMPISDNTTEAGRAKNRRIEFKVVPE